MKSIIRYTILTAMRDWLYIGILLLALASIFLSSFLGGTAIVEQGYMSMAYIGGSCRIIIIVGLILFVCFHVRRSFENKEIELILTRPISRVQFVLAYYTGFAILSFTIVAPLALMLMFLWAIGYVWGSPLGIIYWAVSFYFESLIMVAFAFFASLILNSAVSAVLASFAFYFLARMFGFLLISMQNPASLTHASIFGRTMETFLSAISVVMPRLDMFSKTEWLNYGVLNFEQYSLFMVTAAIYIPLLIVMALFDFVRKQF